MKATDHPKLRQGTAFTKIELLAVVVVLAVGLAMLLPALGRAKAKRQRVACVNNLKNIGLAFRIWDTSGGGYFPWQVDAERGGTIRFTNDPTALWRHFAAVSNELSTPLPVFCPTDKERRPARSWAALSNNLPLSYFLGLDGSEEQPNSILAGDRNLMLDGRSLSNEVVVFGARTNVAFDRRMHIESGNLLLGDGSVQRVSNTRLQAQFHDASLVSTNTLVSP